MVNRKRREACATLKRLGVIQEETCPYKVAGFTCLEAWCKFKHEDTYCEEYKTVLEKVGTDIVGLSSKEFSKAVIDLILWNTEQGTIFSAEKETIEERFALWRTAWLRGRKTAYEAEQAAYYANKAR
jgi:hypothetical protein